MPTLDERAEALSPLNRVLQVLLGTKDHMFHGRPGVNINGTWRPVDPKNKEEVEEWKKFRAGQPGRPKGGGTFVKPGIFVPAAVKMYEQLLEVFKADNELAAKLASYALLETDHKDLKVACAALMLVQNRAGQTIPDPEGNFNDEDFRAVGEAMMGWYQKGATKKMFNPKMLLDVRALLSVPEIAKLNREAGFGDPQGKKVPQGRWPKAVQKYLRYRELNTKLLEGAVKSGFGNALRNLSRQSAYKPMTQKYFEALRWPQRQSPGGHRTIGLDGPLHFERLPFVGATEEQIVEHIRKEKLGFQTVVGALPKDVGLTPRIMKALVGNMSDKNVTLFIPTLEDLGLLKDKDIQDRITRALKEVEDERVRNIAKNVRDEKMKGKMEAAADGAAQKAVNQEIQERPLKILIGVDVSGSMSGVLDVSKEFIGWLLPGFADQEDKITVQVFNTNSRTVKFRQYSKVGVATALGGFSAGGGTYYASALRRAAKDGFKVEQGEDLIVIFIGDSVGESGQELQETFDQLGWKPAALALVPVVDHVLYGQTVQSAAQRMRVPLTLIDLKTVSMTDDPYVRIRFLKNLLAAMIPVGPVTQHHREVSLVEKILKQDLITPADRNVLLAPV